MLNITIDGRALEAREGQTVLEVAREAGIHIPTLCYLAERSAIGSCRVCVVDVEGQDAPVPACTTRVVDGMQVQTATERVLKYRRMAVDLLISNHGLGFDGLLLQLREERRLRATGRGARGGRLAPHLPRCANAQAGAGFQPVSALRPQPVHRLSALRGRVQQRGRQPRAADG